jgi:hypothetical protein
VQHASAFDDRLLASEVEMALKALGIVASCNEQATWDLRSAVEDLRSGEASNRPVQRNEIAPALLADDEIFGLR